MTLALLADAAAQPALGQLALNAFMQFVLPPLLVALAALAGLALKKLSDFLHVRTQGSKMGAALVQGTDWITAAVSHVISGLAPAVRDALANDGKIDDAERAALKAKAMELIKAEFPAGLSAVLGAAGGGLETWLSGKAEQAISAAVSAGGSSAGGAGPQKP
jgi:hypothetical protein